MKKTITRLMFVVMVVLSVFNLSACTDSEPEARVAVEGFLNAIVSFDAETAASYVDDKGLLGENFYSTFSADFEKIMLDAFEGASSDETSPAIKEFFNEFKTSMSYMADKMKEMMSYEITNVEKVGRTYVYDIKMSYPSDEGGDIEKMISEAFTEDEITEIITQMITSGEISLSASQDDILKAVFSKMVPRIKDIIENYEIKSDETTFKLAVKKVSGEWKVPVVENGLHNIKSIGEFSN